MFAGIGNEPPLEYICLAQIGGLEKYSVSARGFVDWLPGELVDWLAENPPSSDWGFKVGDSKGVFAFERTIFNLSFIAIIWDKTRNCNGNWLSPYPAVTNWCVVNAPLPEIPLAEISGWNVRWNWK